MGKGLEEQACSCPAVGWAGASGRVPGAAPPLASSLPTVTLFAAPSGVVEVYTTSWFLAGKEEGMTPWGYGWAGRVQGWTLGTRGRGSGWAPLEARVDERLSRTPPLDPRSRATSLRIQVWGKEDEGGGLPNLAGCQGHNPFSTQTDPLWSLRLVLGKLSHPTQVTGDRPHLVRRAEGPPAGSSSWGWWPSPLQQLERKQEWRPQQGDPSESVRCLPPTLPASCRSKLHTRSARPSVSACNLEAASGPGTLERSNSSAEGPPERVRDALSSCRVRVTACCRQAALGKEAG